MKYFNKNLYRNEIYNYIIQILGDTNVKLLITETSNVIAINDQWKISIGKNNISIVAVRVKRLVFKFSDLFMMDDSLIFKIKKVIKRLLYNEYSNEMIFDLICNFNHNISLLKKHISQDNQSHFNWFFSVSCYSNILELLIGIYKPSYHIGDIRMTLGPCKVLELFYSIPSGVYYLCKDPNNTQELTEFIINSNERLNNEKNKQLQN